ncbi:hypothetical protein ACFR9U_19075 [Halorientalis brevis]|uniref:Uncharacterized protein n=1 Tax=Halorientalis brevis TaxID=1126241 RepID=A0ABD6CGC3_9EURY|nr:hypothetical protein [Halorientalis brevis]
MRIDNPDVEGNVRDVDANIDGEFSVDINVSDIDGEVDANIGANLGDDRGTATPENQKATKYIMKARDELTTAHQEYAKQASNRNSILAVRPTLGSFSWLPIKRHVKKAMDHLEEGAKYARGGQANNVLALEHAGYFLLLGAKADGRLIKAFKHFKFSRDRLYNESLVQSTIARRRMNTDWKEARDIYRELDKKIKPEGLNVLSQLDERYYERKNRQLDNGIAAFIEFDDSLKAAKQGLERVEPGVDAYLGDEFERAVDEFTRASARFGVANSPLTVTRDKTGLASVARDFHTVIKTMEQATEDLRRSSQGKVDGDRLIYYEAQRSAKQHIESNETVKDISSFEDIRL